MEPCIRSMLSRVRVVMSEISAIERAMVLAAWACRPAVPVISSMAAAMRWVTMSTASRAAPACAALRLDDHLARALLNRDHDGAGIALDALDARTDRFGGIGAVGGEGPHFLGDDGEARAIVAGAGRLNGPR